MASKMKIAWRSWTSSVRDLSHYVRSQAKKYHLARTASIIAGFICLGLASYLVLVNTSLFNVTLPDTDVSNPAALTESENNDIVLVPVNPVREMTPLDMEGATPTASIGDPMSDAVETTTPKPDTSDADNAMATNPIPKVEDRLPEPQERETPKLATPEPEVRLPTAVDPSTMRWPVAGTIDTPYGWYRHPAIKDWRFNPGITIAAPEGVPVRAAMTGEVTSVQYSPDRGLTVAMDHGSGWLTYYGHLQEADVKPGDRVEKGYQLGCVGTAANGQSQLFFSLRFEEEEIDPTAFLRD